MLSLFRLICNKFVIYKNDFIFHRESNLLKRIFQCCLLNGGFFGLSIILFEYVLLPIIRLFLSWMFTRNPGNGAIIGNYIVTFLSILFGMVWIMPLFILSKVVNSLWFQVSLLSFSETKQSTRHFFFALLKCSHMRVKIFYKKKLKCTKTYDIKI